MFTLRVFQNKHNDQTNTHVATFGDNHTLAIDHSDLAHLDWETCVFQIYPTNAQRQTFYTLPDGHSLCLFDQEGALLGQTHTRDEYIYFKPIQRASYTFRLVVTKNGQ